MIFHNSPNKQINLKSLSAYISSITCPHSVHQEISSMAMGNITAYFIVVFAILSVSVFSLCLCSVTYISVFLVVHVIQRVCLCLVFFFFCSTESGKMADFIG